MPELNSDFAGSRWTRDNNRHGTRNCSVCGRVIHVGDDVVPTPGASRESRSFAHVDCLDEEEVQPCP